jgi:hypothetical protein
MKGSSPGRRKLQSRPHRDDDLTDDTSSSPSLSGSAPTRAMTWGEFSAYFSTVMAVAVAVGAGLTRYLGWWE